LIPSLNDLRVVPLDRLILHEAHDPGRLVRLRRRIREDGVQRHPVIIAPYERSYLVLDGAHRVQVLKDLGCRFVLTQNVEPPARAESWGHMLRNAGLESAFREIEGIEVSGEPEDYWLAAVKPAGRECAFVRARERSLPAEVRALWSLQTLYPAAGAVHRVDPEADVELESGEALIRYRNFTPTELVEIVRSGAVLPAGITRFRVRERILGVRFPLEKIAGGDLEARNAELQAFVREHWDLNRIRYYGEPVVLFE
jgi:hypothetical protein